MRRVVVTLMLAIGILVLSSPAVAQTPDGTTPATEEACTKYEGEGARQGLCIAYCEAQDCDATKFSNPSCAGIAERFIAWSVKKGYVASPKEKPTISCKATACTTEDIKYCGGQERDCLNSDGACEAKCTSTFEGFNPGGVPICALIKCKECVGKDPEK
jgi:hypothetical protein